MLAGVKELNEALGFYGFWKSIADTGKFQVAGKTAMQSAFDADLHEVLNYLAASKLEREYEERLMEEHKKRQK